MTKSYVRTATRSTLKVEANLTQILNFKANFHTEFEPFFKKKIYANNGGHFNPIRSGGGALKAPPPIFCSHAFNFGAALLCVGDFS